MKVTKKKYQLPCFDMTNQKLHITKQDLICRQCGHRDQFALATEGMIKIICRSIHFGDEVLKDILRVSGFKTG